MSRKLFIVFESLNGGGKSTLAKMLADKLGAYYVSSPPESLADLRPLVDNNVSLTTRFLYYLFGKALISEEVKELKQYGTVVCDRYVHSTLSVHKLLGVDIDVLPESFELEKPDVSFFIYNSDEQERIDRINQRGKKTKYDVLQEDDEFRENYMDYFRSCGGFIFIDTAHKSPNQSLLEIEEALKEVLG